MRWLSGASVPILLPNEELAGSDFQRLLLCLLILY